MVAVVVFASKWVLCARAVLVVAGYGFFLSNMKTGIVSNEVCPASENGPRTFLFPAGFPRELTWVAAFLGVARERSAG